ncbi:hypothetical protein FQZ97_954000 [compost metagenome]
MNHTVLDDAGEGHTDRRVGGRRVRARVELGDHRCDRFGNRLGRRGLRRRNAEAVAHEFALFEVDNAALDSGSADVDSDQRGVLG